MSLKNLVLQLLNPLMPPPQPLGLVSTYPPTANGPFVTDQGIFCCCVFLEKKNPFVLCVYKLHAKQLRLSILLLQSREMPGDLEKAQGMEEKRGGLILIISLATLLSI